ncbi:MAG: gamma carbonic anhydrase family protein [Chloroflexi bacterium]|nr:gamma carbonic anhydrase family protein [Chloroflexota bacterium]
MPLLPYLRTMPTVADDVEIDDEAFVIGKVTVARGVRIGRRTVLRGDQSPILVGEGCRFGNEATVHVDPDKPTTIGVDVVVEDRAVVHGCTVGDAVLVEREATILSGSVVGAGSIVQADALVPEGREIPPRSVVSGTPGRVIRQTTDEEVEAIRRRARRG